MWIHQNENELNSKPNSVLFKSLKETLNLTTVFQINETFAINYYSIQYITFVYTETVCTMMLKKSFRIFDMLQFRLFTYHFE